MCVGPRVCVCVGSVFRKYGEKVGREKKVTWAAEENIGEIGEKLTH